MAKHSARRRGSVSGQGKGKRATQRSRGKSLSAAIPRDYEAVESVTERHIMEHAPVTRGMDARFLSLPALNIISLLGFAVIAAWSVSQFKWDVQTQMRDISSQVTIMQAAVAQMSKRIDEIGSDSDAKAKRRWSRLDMQMWCKDTEETNRDNTTGKKGFTCGAIGPMSLDGAAQ